MKTLIKSVLLSLLLVATSAWAGPVNINTADAETLAKELKGVGPKRAEKIVEYREQHGNFTSPYDLAEIAGIGERIVQQNLDNIRLTDE